jgi:hypothetical protein
MAMGMGACGPLIPVPADTDGDGDTQPDPDDDDDTLDSTVTTPTPTTTSPGGCDPGCPPGYTCVYGVCEYYCQSCCVGECGGYYECFGHNDCGEESYCNYYSCAYLPYVFACEPSAVLVAQTLVGLPSAASLAFVDTNGDGFDDLVAFGEPEGWILRGPDASESIPVDLSGGGQGDVAGTEFDGVPPSEVTFSSQKANALLTMRVITEPEAVAISEPALERMVAGDFDGDGREDVAGLIGPSLYAMFSDGVQFSAQTYLGLDLLYEIAPAVGSLGFAPGEDLAVSNGFMFVTEAWPDGSQSTQLEENYPLDVRTPVVGDFDANGMEDILAIGERPGYPTALAAMWLQIAPGELSRQPYFRLPEVYVTVDGTYAAAASDVDGDGRSDLVIGGYGVVTVFFSQLACWQQVAIEGDARRIAVGDFDGDNRADIAWTDSIGTAGIVRAG